LNVPHEIVGQALQLLRSPEEASRNRAYEDFSRSLNRRALFLYKIIKSLENELSASRGVGRFAAIPIQDGMVELRFVNPALRYTRICYLPQELFAWLSQRLSLQGCQVESSRALPEA